MQRLVTSLLFGVLLQLLIPSQQTYANSLFSPTYEERLEEGMEAFYRMDWNRATEVFDELKEREPQNPRAYFFESMIPLWKYFFGQASDQTAERFLRLAEQAIEISKQRLKENSSDTTMVLVLSGLYGYASLVAANQKEYRTAIEKGMTGFKYTRQLLSIDSDDPRALIGKGVFYYMMGTVPNKLRWMTNLIGVKGDEEEGFSFLEKAANSNFFISNDAKMILAYLYEKEERYPKALQHLSDLVRRYPQNSIFRFNQARMLEKCDKKEEAQQAYHSVVELDNVHLRALKNRSLERLGRILP